MAKQVVRGGTMHSMGSSRKKYSGSLEDLKQFTLICRATGATQLNRSLKNSGRLKNRFRLKETMEA